MIRWFFYTIKAYIFNRKETLVLNKEKSAIIGGPEGHKKKNKAAPRLQEDGSTQLQVTSNTDITGYYQT